MSDRFHVEVTAVEPVHDIPGRFASSGLRELVEALDGEVADGEDVWDALARTFRALPLQELSERLLDLVLIKPPIPAGCEALVTAMRDPQTAPWHTHDVREDRVWLWYCHRLLHHAMPEDFADPTVVRVDLVASTLHPSVRPPGPRTSAHDRVETVANLLAARDSADNPLADEHGEDWAFDTVWAAEVTGREKLAPSEAETLGAEAEAAASGRLVGVRISAWMAPRWIGDLAAGASWTAA